MRNARVIVPFLFVALLISCVHNDIFTSEGTRFVAPQLVACETGSGNPQLADPATTSKRCLQISVSVVGPFNPVEEISGFNFEPGYRYKLSVRESFNAIDGSVDYVLLSVLEKTPAP